MMKCYFPPYEGDEPYIFFSYCHKDEKIDYGMIDRLCVDGYRVWYDDGIHPGTDWPEIVAEHLERSCVCIAALSKDSAESANCKNEMTYAIGAKKPLIPVIIQNFNMSRGLKLQICSTNFIKYYEYTGNDEAFYAQLEKADSLAACQDGTIPTEVELKEWRERAKQYMGLPGPPSPPRPPIDNEIERIRAEAEKKAADIRKKQAERRAEAKQKAEKDRQEEEKLTAEENKTSEELEKAMENARRIIADAEKKADDIRKRQNERRERAKEEAAAAKKEEEKLTIAEESAIEKIKREAEEKIRQLFSGEVAERIIKEAKEKAEKIIKEARKTVLSILMKFVADPNVTVVEGQMNLTESEAEKESWRISDEAVKAIGQKYPAVPYANMTPEQARTEAERIEAAASEAAALAIEMAKEWEKKTVAFVIGKSSGQIYELYDGTTALGSSREIADVWLEDRTGGIKGHHADIICGGAGCYIKKTAPDGRALLRGKSMGEGREKLRDFDTFTLGGEEFIFIGGELLKSVPKIRDKKSVCWLTADRTGETKLLGGRTILLDRNNASEWGGGVLTSNKISREKMAAVTCTADTYSFENVPKEKAKNKCFLNGKEIQPGDSRKLSDGDVIDIAGCDVFTFSSLRLV